MLLTLIIIFSFCYIIYYKVLKPHKYWYDRGVPHRKPVPIFGDLIYIILQKFSIPDYVQATYRQFPEARYVGLYQFNTPILLVKDLELVKQITVSDFRYFSDRSIDISIKMDSLVGNYLLFLKGEKYLKMKSLIGPAFATMKIKKIFAGLSERARRYVEYFQEMDQEVVIPIEMKDLSSRFKCDVHALKVFGIQSDSLREKNNSLFLMSKEASSLFRTFIFMVYAAFPIPFQFFNIPLVPKRSGNFFRKIVKEAITNAKTNGPLKSDVFTHLVEAQRKQSSKPPQIQENTKEARPDVSDTDITGLVLNLLLGSFETNATAMAFMGYELAINPTVQKKLQEEIDAVLQENNANEIPHDAINDMKYLDMVVSESLRKWPSGYLIDRRCVRPYTIPPKYQKETTLTIEEGTTVWIPIMAIHNDSMFFPEPEKFIPERFADRSTIVKGSYFPFGAGPKKCVGANLGLLSMKMLYFYLLSKFDIVPITRTQIPIILEKNSALLAAQRGIWLGLKRRDNFH